MWILNYGTTHPLISYSIVDGWKEYEFDIGAYMYPVDIFFNNSETFWISLDKNFGGGIIVYNPYSNDFKKLNLTSNFLPNNSVNSLVIDKNDIVGILKKQTKANRFKPENNIVDNYWFTLDRDDVFKFTGKKFSPYVIYLSGNNELPKPKLITANISNNHKKYAMTWFSLAISIFILYLYFRRKYY